MGAIWFIKSCSLCLPELMKVLSFVRKAGPDIAASGAQLTGDSGEQLLCP